MRGCATNSLLVPFILLYKHKMRKVHYSVFYNIVFFPSAMSFSVTHLIWKATYIWKNIQSACYLIEPIINEYFVLTMTDILTDGCQLLNSARWDFAGFCTWPPLYTLTYAESLMTNKNRLLKRADTKNAGFIQMVPIEW